MSQLIRDAATNLFAGFLLVVSPSVRAMLQELNAIAMKTWK